MIEEFEAVMEAMDVTQVVPKSNTSRSRSSSLGPIFLFLV